MKSIKYLKILAAIIFANFHSTTLHAIDDNNAKFKNSNTKNEKQFLAPIIRGATSFEAMTNDTQVAVIPMDKSKQKSKTVESLHGKCMVFGFIPQFKIGVINSQVIDIDQLGESFVPSVTEILIKDADGTNRTVFTFKQCMDELIDKPESIYRNWISWLSFGRNNDYAYKFRNNKKLNSQSLQLNVSDMAIFGVGIQQKDKERVSSLNPFADFMPYSGFDLSRSSLGYFLSMGLVDSGKISWTRKISEVTGNYYAADVSSTGWIGYDAEPEEIVLALKKQRDNPQKISDSSIFSYTDNIALNNFISIHHIIGLENMPGSTFFQAVSAEKQDAVLPISINDVLTFKDRVLAGEYENGRKFILGTIKIPEANCWCMIAKYDDETYPRLAFCILNMIGTTRDGKSFSWIQLPGRTKDTNKTATLYELEHRKIDWKIPIFDSRLDMSNFDLDNPEYFGDYQLKNAKKFMLVPAINGVH